MNTLKAQKPISVPLFIKDYVKFTQNVCACHKRHGLVFNADIFSPFSKNQMMQNTHIMLQSLSYDTVDQVAFTKSSLAVRPELAKWPVYSASGSNSPWQGVPPNSITVEVKELTKGTLINF